MLIHSEPGQESDRIDEVVEFWRRENPNLDVTTKCLGMRLRTTARLLEQALRQEMTLVDVEVWEFEMLLALRRSDGLQRTAGWLLREFNVTSGAITNRLSRLEDRGWVRREMDPSDRRQVLVTLTDSGLVRADELIATKTQAEERFYAGVPRATLERLGDDLRTLLAAVERYRPPEG